MPKLNLPYHLQPEEIFVVSDHHFGHEEVITQYNRPFQSIHDMTETAIRRWNEVVTKRSWVIYLGDIGLGTKELFEYVFSRLHYGQIFLVTGNHDVVRGYWKDQFSKIYTDQYLEVAAPNAPGLICCHFPMLSWKKKAEGYRHCYGHVHNNMPDLQRMLSVNVCVEMWDFYPPSLAQIDAFLKKKLAHGKISCTNDTL